MTSVMDSVNQRTQLVGQNRLELLLFRLNGDQLYGINVFKVKEVLQCPNLTNMPKSSHVVKGVANVRGGTIPIIDMGMATKVGAVAPEGSPLEDRFVIITEYNRKTQGFLVGGVERIINLNWEDILPPPSGVGPDNYLAAVTEIEGKLVEIIDVEKVFAEVTPMDERINDQQAEELSAKNADKSIRILIVDDSVVARKQVQNCLEAIGLEVVAMKNGLVAYEHLKEILADGSSIHDHYALMISDVEMPEMDGYTLTAKCKSDPALAPMYIILHTSLSGVFNRAMVDKVGADNFIAKFDADELTENVMKAIDARASV